MKVRNSLYLRCEPPHELGKGFVAPLGHPQEGGSGRFWACTRQKVSKSGSVYIGLWERLCDRAGVGVGEAARASATRGYGGSTSGGTPRFKATGDSVCGGAAGGAVWPVCASSPAVVSVRSWSSVGWVEPRGSAREVGYLNGGARIRLKYSSSGRPLTPARRSGWVGSRRDSSDGQVSLVVGFAIPLPHRGARAFIVSDVGYSYLVTLLPLWPTMSSYPSTTPVVLAVGGVDLTYVRSAIRPLTPPILASDRLPASGQSRRRASCPRARSIPNLVVKLYCGDDTVWEVLRKNSSTPE
ncbi:hypothetical protein B296_00044036 [Ensete ventricosum]|uniref:Uncharacterized protein n=1 Tax=Ensete ventricosum TaxID=4639 RepID=A0A426WZC1_ENSVE|nr:hypothetical protein B296_00044036 [Ensete ventricosum]